MNQFKPEVNYNSIALFLGFPVKNVEFFLTYAFEEVLEEFPDEFENTDLEDVLYEMLEKEFPINSGEMLSSFSTYGDIMITIDVKDYSNSEEIENKVGEVCLNFWNKFNLGKYVNEYLAG